MAGVAPVSAAGVAAEGGATGGAVVSAAVVAVEGVAEGVAVDSAGGASSAVHAASAHASTATARTASKRRGRIEFTPRSMARRRAAVGLLRGAVPGGPVPGFGVRIGLGGGIGRLGDAGAGDAREYAERTGRRVTFAYALLAGVNDAPEQARRLASPR